MLLRTLSMFTFAVLLLLLPTKTTGYKPDTGQHGGCIAREREALLSIKAGITYDRDELLSSWQGQDCCRWFGIRCSNRTGHVIKLNLRTGYLEGEISCSLKALERLQHLDLSGNHNLLVGPQGRLPHFLGSLYNLRYLNLSGVICYGPVPHQLGNLSRLLFLGLGYDSGQLYSTDLSWLRQLTSLTYLDMSNVNVSTVTGWMNTVNMLSSLEVLILSGCGVSGDDNTVHSGPLSNLTRLKIIDLSFNYLEISDAVSLVTGATSLKYLDLQNNCVSGLLPAELGNLSSLEVFQMSENYVKGMIPGTLTSAIGTLFNLTYLDLGYNHMDGLITEEHFSKLSDLQHLHLSANSFTMEWNSDWVPPFRLNTLGLKSCSLGPRFPRWLKWQKNISSLFMSNASIADTMPDWFWNVFSQAVILDLSSNNISGTLPAALGRMEVSFLDLSSNRFSGSVQQVPPHIVALDLSRNILSGPLPWNFQQPMLVQILLLSNNYFTGTISTSICLMKFLSVFDVGNNMITGELPQCPNVGSKVYESPSLGPLPPIMVSPITVNCSGMQISMSLRTLRLNNNNLSGEFPSLLQNFSELTFIDLGQNKFSGSIPNWIGMKLAQLGILRLRSNMFSGYIPTQLRELGHLQYLDLAYNNFSGTIPQSLVNMDSVTDTTEREYQYSLYSGPDSSTDLYGIISAVIKGQEREYIGEYMYMVSLDLSCNHLTGDIPTSIGPKKGLVNMNLSRNHLTGKIPENIGSMHLLESLDLSYNELSGEIPSSLSDLTSLSYLNLSYNNLSGRIPTGHQLDTLSTTDPASMYIGNIGLCGPPLPKNCSENGTVPSHFRVRKEGSDIMTFYFGLSMGFVVGLWIVFCSLLFNKTWRASYYRLFDKMYEKIYVFVVLNWARMVKDTDITF
ncbi:unnamed protein product [Urochloa decumbens]|uniref:Leucine-rich repeat-containing N-terminal plant-type domain-containing protein n=1 Tax=Urochloa decumbens TaxID=240449 RepID=A0ABC9E6L5_9POAL